MEKKGLIAEFKEFVMRGNVLDMAVGVIIGGAFGSIVSSLVDDAEEDDADNEEDGNTEDGEDGMEGSEEDAEDSDGAKEDTEDDNEESDLNASMAEENFDAEFYAATYPDVVAVFGNSPEALYKHYLDYGKAEGRSCNAEEFALLNESSDQ